MCSNSVVMEFPEDILVEIFLRLPAKSVGKFRCLSKTWQSNLSTKHFEYSHLARQRERPILSNYNSGSLYVLNDHELPLEMIEQENKRDRLRGSCNGLLLQCDEKYDMFVVNPVTHQRVQIPRSRIPKVHIYGFGYDAASDDYKVVIGSYGIFEVYSLRKQVWKEVGCFPSDYFRGVFDMAPYANGAVHWLTQDKDCEIIAFDLATETLHQFPFPTGFRREYSIDLVVIKGCLTIVNRFLYGSVDVWMMKEYGVMDSWVRYHFDVNVIGIEITPLCFLGEELLCLGSFINRDCWVVCDLRGEMPKKVVGGQYPFYKYHMNWSVFVENLISFEQGTVSS